jgi:hypothetical protein
MPLIPMSASNKRRVEVEHQPLAWEWSPKHTAMMLVPPRRAAFAASQRT